MAAEWSRWGRSRDGRPVLERTADAFRWTYDEDGAVGVVDDRIGDVAHEGTTHATIAAAADDDQAGVDVFGEVDDGLILALVHPEVGPRNLPAGLLDLLDLRVEHPFGLLLAVGGGLPDAS